MSAERIVHQFRDRGPFGHRIVAIDTTDPGIHAEYPYELVRTGFSGQRVMLCGLRRQDLEALHEALGRELGRS